jgi:hypothetical protein
MAFGDVLATDEDFIMQIMSKIQKPVTEILRKE